MMLLHGVCGLRSGFSDRKMQPGEVCLYCRTWIRQIVFGLLTSSSPDFRASLKLREIRYLTFSPGLEVGRFTSSRGMAADPIWGCVISLVCSCCTQWTRSGNPVPYLIPFAGILGMRGGLGMREWVTEVMGRSWSFGGIGPVSGISASAPGQDRRNDRDDFFSRYVSVSVVCGEGSVCTCMWENLVPLPPRFRPSRRTV